MRILLTISPPSCRNRDLILFSFPRGSRQNIFRHNSSLFPHPFSVLLVQIFRAKLPMPRLPKTYLLPVVGPPPQERFVNLKHLGNISCCEKKFGHSAKNGQFCSRDHKPNVFDYQPRDLRRGQKPRKNDGVSRTSTTFLPMHT